MRGRCAGQLRPCTPQCMRTHTHTRTRTQVAGPADLEALRDQAKQLKRACRHRTMLAWKQARIQQEQDLSGALHGAFGALEAEAKYMTVRAGVRTCRVQVRACLFVEA